MAMDYPARNGPMRMTFLEMQTSPSEKGIPDGPSTRLCQGHMPGVQVSRRLAAEAFARAFHP